MTNQKNDNQNFTFLNLALQFFTEAWFCPYILIDYGFADLEELQAKSVCGLHLTQRPIHFAFS